MREKAKSSIIIGNRAVEELILSGKTISKVIINKKADKVKLGIFQKLCESYKIPLQTVPIEKLNRVTNGNHQGVIAFVSPIEYTDYEHFITESFEKGVLPKILVLDGLQDVGNIGAIARSASAFGVDLIIVGTKSNAEIGPGAVQASAGTILNLPIARTPDLTEALDYLKNWGIVQIAASEKGTELKLNEPIVDKENTAWALWLGNENYGLDEHRIKMMDKIIRIPMRSKVDSLNVSVAAGILLFKLSQ